MALFKELGVFKLSVMNVKRNYFVGLVNHFLITFYVLNNHMCININFNKTQAY